MAEHVRADLEEPLAGKHVLVDPDEVTMGFLEDIQTSSAAGLLDALAGVIVGGDLSGGVDRAGLRRLKVAEFAALTKGVTSAITEVPKAG